MPAQPGDPRIPKSEWTASQLNGNEL